MRGYFKKKFFVVLLAFIFVLPIIPVGATQATRDQLRELERQRAAAGQRVSEQANILAGTEFEMSQVVAEMQELDQQIIDASEALEAIEIDLLDTEIRIGEAQEDLTLATAERDLQLEILRERVRTMHEQGSSGLIEILFHAESISDFFSRLEYIRTVTQFDRELLARLEASEERRASSLDTLTSNRALVLDLQQEIILVKEEIEQSVEEKKVFFALLHADAERHRELEAILREEKHIIDIEFGIVRARHDEEVREAERIRRAEEDARRAAEAAARAAARASELEALGSFSHFAWPLPARGPSDISSGFGNRPDPFTGRNENHSGIDVPAPSGSRINAAAAGIVSIATWSASWGNYIVIDHAGGYSTLYAHNSRNRVAVGARVTQGQHIADVGTTGRSTGNHLHFEIRKNGVHKNPMSYFGG
ncbi:MAG: peptidoglycan DD-metalloendopeptidase family protein [Defluviitaleaceae bacterium]|nr:peptidoglycan DD-metalloendopeptidase family protein [Defluviitaleaceae bacterium]